MDCTVKLNIGFYHSICKMSEGNFRAQASQLQYQKNKPPPKWETPAGLL